jgi:hypothetical protein
MFRCVTSKVNTSSHTGQGSSSSTVDPVNFDEACSHDSRTRLVGLADGMVCCPALEQWIVNLNCARQYVHTQRSQMGVFLAAECFEFQFELNQCCILRSSQAHSPTKPAKPARLITIQPRANTAAASITPTSHVVDCFETIEVRLLVDRLDEHERTRVDHV